MKRAALAFPLLALAAACAPDEGVPAWCTAPEGAALRVASGPPRALGLEEVWRVGGAEGEEVFAGPIRAAVSPRGRVIVPDGVAGGVLLVEPDGTWRGSVAGQGDGPGEVRWPVDAEWLDEDRVAVFDLGRGAVMTISVSGEKPPTSWSLNAELYGRIAAAGELPGADVASDGGLLLQLPWDAGSPPGETAVAAVVRLTPDGSVDTLRAQDVRVVHGGPFVNWPVPGEPRPLFAAGAGGPIFLAGRTAGYLVDVLGGTGPDSAVLCRPVPPLPSTPAERGDVGEPGPLSDLLRGLDLPEVPAAIGGLVPGERGRLWVLRNRPDPGAPHLPLEGGTYDLFDAAGGYVGTLRAPERTYLVGEGGGQVYGFFRGPYDEVVLVAFRVVSPQPS